MAEPQYSDIPSGAQVMPPAYSDMPSGAQVVSASKFSDLPKGAQVVSPSYSDLPANAAILHDPAGTGQAKIRAYQPSVWDRIKKAITAGIPNYSSRTVYNPKYGETQLLSPEEAMTPSEQRAHPIATGIGEVAGGLTSPQSIALLYGTAGLGELPAL